MPHSLDSVVSYPTSPAREGADSVQATSPQVLARSLYVPPRVQLLGPWEAVTLLYTVPIGPGGRLLPRDRTF